jgi:hypothetical protein
METRMTQLKILSAAAALAVLVATPALAQVAPPYAEDGSYNLQNPGTTEAQPNSPPYSGIASYRGAYASDSGPAWSNSYAFAPDDYGYRYHRTGFLPGDIAATAIGGAIGIAGTAVHTAGAIATAPFRAGSVREANAAMDANSCAQRYRSYDPATGTYLARNGHRHACP